MINTKALITLKETRQRCESEKKKKKSFVLGFSKFDAILHSNFLSTYHKKNTQTRIIDQGK